jgi:anti-sigma-K factor RskA
LWQERVAAMTELQPSIQPSPNVWLRIANLLQASKQTLADHPATALLEQIKRALGWWRGAALAGGLASVLAITVGVRLSQELDKQPLIQYVAVLADDQSAASMLVTFDPKNKNLTLKRVGSYHEASDRSLQLWALPQGGKPQSLGVLGGTPVIKLTAAETAIRQVPTLAISLEPKGGVPSERGPTGPVLFKGALLETTL